MFVATSFLFPPWKTLWVLHTHLSTVLHNDEQNWILSYPHLFSLSSLFPIPQRIHSHLKRRGRSHFSWARHSIQLSLITDYCGSPHGPQGMGPPTSLPSLEDSAFVLPRHIWIILSLLKISLFLNNVGHWKR